MVLFVVSYVASHAVLRRKILSALKYDDELVGSFKGAWKCDDGLVGSLEIWIHGFCLFFFIFFVNLRFLATRNQ